MRWIKWTRNKWLDRVIANTSPIYGIKPFFFFFIFFKLKKKKNFFMGPSWIFFFLGEKMEHFHMFNLSVLPCKDDRKVLEHLFKVHGFFIFIRTKKNKCEKPQVCSLWYFLAEVRTSAKTVRCKHVTCQALTRGFLG